MANTERLNAIRMLRECKIAISELRFSDQIESEKRQLLETAYLRLHLLEDKLILEEITQNVEAIKAAASDLGEVSEEIRETIEGLENVAENSEKAATAVGILASIASRAASGGLLG